MKAVSTIAFAITVLIASSCQKSFKPSDFTLEFTAVNCITGRFGTLETTKKICKKEEETQTVRIYNDCKSSFVKSKSESYYAKPECEKHSDWLIALQKNVDDINKELEKERQDKRLKADLNVKIDKCLDAVDGIPLTSRHTNSFGDRRDGPHPLCANVLEQAQSRYVSNKKWRCNSSMESYSRNLRDGDYYGANSALGFAVDDCN